MILITPFLCAARWDLSLACSYSWSEQQYSYFHLISQSIWYSLARRESVIWFAPKKHCARRFQSASICLPSAKCFRCQHACNYDAARKKAHLHIYLKLRTQPHVGKVVALGYLFNILFPFKMQRIMVKLSKCQSMPHSRRWNYFKEFNATQIGLWRSVLR